MGEQTFLCKFMGVLFCMGTNDQIMQGGRESFTNAFSRNLNTVNLKILPGHGGRHLRINPNQAIELWKDLSLMLMVKRFQRLNQVHFP